MKNITKLISLFLLLIVVISCSPGNGKIMLMRLNANGSTDTSFNNGSIFTFGAAEATTAVSPTLGKIYLGNFAGMSTYLEENINDPNRSLYVLGTAGFVDFYEKATRGVVLLKFKIGADSSLSLDKSFGFCATNTDPCEDNLRLGFTLLDFEDVVVVGSSIVVKNKSIFISGYFGNNNLGYHRYIANFTEEGEFNPNFGKRDYIIDDNKTFEHYYNNANKLTERDLTTLTNKNSIDYDYGEPVMGVVRIFNKNELLDGGLFKWLNPFTDIALQDNKIIVSANIFSENKEIQSINVSFYVARLNSSSGSMDLTFGNKGLYINNNGNLFVQGLAISEGKSTTVLTGLKIPKQLTLIDGAIDLDLAKIDIDSFVLKLNDGIPDVNFAQNGLFTYDKKQNDKCQPPKTYEAKTSDENGNVLPEATYFCLEIGTSLAVQKDNNIVATATSSIIATYINEEGQYNLSEVADFKLSVLRITSK